MRAAKLLSALLFLASTAVASPVITSVTPNSGPLTGGTTVVIRGTGFSDNCIICSPPFATPSIYFGSVEATEVTYFDPTRIEAVTPPHVPETVSVTIRQMDGSDPNDFTLPNAFTYQGDIYSAFDPVLFPIFQPPVQGRDGSEFRTIARLWNKSLNETISIYGYDRTCTLIDPPIGPTTPFPLAPRGGTLRLWPECSNSVGRLLYVPKGDQSIAASLRVWEITRQDENHGVEIPVVRREDFSEESIALVDVPTDPKFRLTLRIYGLNRGTDFVNVSFGGRLVQLPLQFTSDPFEPSYAVFTDFRPLEFNPPFPETINVLVDVPRGVNGVHIPGSPIWAFITVTNNETQHITTVTPQH